MTVTKSNESSQMSEGLRLSVEQLNAIDILVQGRTAQETAETVGVGNTREGRYGSQSRIGTMMGHAGILVQLFTQLPSA